MPSPADLLFGKIAVKNKLVDEARVRECLGLLQGSGNGGLGKLLLQRGYLTAGQYQAIQAHVQKLSGSSALADAAAVLPKASPSAPGPISARELAARDYSRLAGGPLDAYIEDARRVGASDLHFQVDAPPFLRIHGEIVYLRHPVLGPGDTEPKILEILNEHQRSVFSKHNDLDFCYEAPHGRYRANVCRQRKGVDAVFRVIPGKLPTLEELHLPSVLKRFTEFRQGIVLITGPAGSGKTATMAALVDMVNERQHDHIVTVEEPIEYIIESKNCNVSQRNVRVHTDTFATALRSAMRADPDYIAVGEMRDLETMAMAITAAETGHLVFGTLHTTNAVRSIDRIIDVFPPKEQDQIRAMVSESMRGVISQQLVPRADGLGREPALEIMFATPAVANMIREKKTFQLPSVLQTGSKQGMITMDDSLAELVRQKLVTRETAAYFAESPDRFR
ncbi:MAG: type IV pilus twitching motility protein PilT [Planctomycetes bacterium]|nr:type IV pilus twitching motility protein PilT [Planctomycetota bacterium]